MSRVLQLVLVTALAAVVVVGAIVLSSAGGDEETPAGTNQPGAPAAEDVLAVYDGLPQDNLRLGEKDAPATLVEIADLQCPFCAQYSVNVLPTLIETYVRSGRANYELHFRSFLGRDSVRAAGAAAQAAKQDLMYQFADIFFRNQGPENSDYADAAFMRMVAEQVPGLDAEKVVAAADEPLSLPAVERGEMFAREIGSTSTPDLYVREDGRLTKVEPAGGSPADYTAAIDAALQ